LLKCQNTKTSAIITMNIVKCFFKYHIRNKSLNKKKILVIFMTKTKAKKEKRNRRRERKKKAKTSKIFEFIKRILLSPFLIITFVIKTLMKKRIFGEIVIYIFIFRTKTKNKKKDKHKQVKEKDKEKEKLQR
jgi:hypothetical protein